MNDLVWVSLIAATGTIVAPVLVSVFTSRARRNDRKQEWARQDVLIQRADAVAAQAAQAARLLLASNADVAAKAKEASVHTNGELKVIRTLVDGTLTKTMESSLDGTRRELALLVQNVDLRRMAGLEPDPAASKIIEAVEHKIEVEASALAHRLEQVRLSELAPAVPGTIQIGDHHG